MKKIGVIGGLAPQSTELFYRELMGWCQQESRVEYPNLLINSLETKEFIKLLDNKEALINFVNNEISKIQDCVDFIVAPCNTLHFIIKEMRAFSKVHIIAIHEEVVKEIKNAKVKKVGLLGTEMTIVNEFYQKELARVGIPYEVLDAEMEGQLNWLIWNKMIDGKDYGKMAELLKKDLEFLKMKGCDSVALVCTELPLFINQKDTDVKLFSSTGILAKATFEYAKT